MSSSQLTKASQPNRPNKFNRDRNSFVSLVQSNAPNKIFTGNTAAHILLPALVGATLAGMLTYVGFEVDGEVIIPPPKEETLQQPSKKQEAVQDQPQEQSNSEAQEKPKHSAMRLTSHYVTYGIASAMASSLVTLGLVGLPDNESDRIRAWLVASVGAITLPLTMQTLLSFNATKAEVTEARIKITEAETKIENTQNKLDQVTKTKDEIEDGYIEILKESQEEASNGEISKNTLLEPVEAIVEDSKELTKKANKSSVNDLKESLEEIEKIEVLVKDVDESKPSNNAAEIDQVEGLKEQIEEVKEDLQVEIKKKQAQTPKTTEADD